MLMPTDTVACLSSSGKDNLGYRDARKAHTLGNSELLEWAKGEENPLIQRESKTDYKWQSSL